VFIKHTFADSFSEQKGKMVEFSTIQFPDEPSIDAKTITKVNEKYKLRTNSVVSEEIKNIPIPESLTLNEEIPFPTPEEEKLDIPEVSEKLNHTLNFKNLEEESTALNKTRNTKTYGSKSKLSRQTSSKRVKTTTKIKKSDSSFSQMFIILILVLLAGGGYLYIKKPGLFNLNSEDNFVADAKSCLGQKDNKKCYDKCQSGDRKICFAMNTIPKTTNPKPNLNTTPDPTPNVVNTASKEPPKYSIYIDSTPSLAEVYIDDVRQPGLTPMKVEVPAKSDFKLRIAKDKYNEVEKKVYASSENFKINEILSELKHGYLIINSPNAGLQYEIKINNKTKATYALRQQIQVPAETKLNIEVTNSLGFKAVQEVFVKENTRQTIEIVLKKVE
jgi:hypothetical protein